MKYLLVAVLAGGIGLVPGPATAVSAACDYPAQVLNLANWKIQLPIGQSERPDEVKQPSLATYRVDPWFKVNTTCDGVRFRAAVNGVTTSGSNYPRSELREMNGTTNAGWSSTSGTHILTIDQAVNRLPDDKPHIVVGQIHNGTDDVSVFRVEGTNLYVTNDNDSHHKLVTSNFALNTRFQVKFVVSGGQIKAYYNGVLQTTITRSFTGGYFKAGAYTQANCTNSTPCSSANYGEATIYNVTLGDAAPPPPPPPPSLPVSAVTARGDDGNVPANTLDNNLATRWSDEGDGTWVRYDLGSAQPLSKVAIAWYRGDERRSSFTVETSTDGTAWSTAVSTRDSTGTTTGPETYDFADRTARYLRIVGFGNTVNNWTSITETDIYRP
ncbi:polysaccharide lyase family 7 protein [Actinokineospora sp.]|uniref:polysaccharide lyase family 7 protein n=1 Tax=Actinokineospora sp. TaxID=1872133 RepID=UPI004037F392